MENFSANSLHIFQFTIFICSSVPFFYVPQFSVSLLCAIIALHWMSPREHRVQEGKVVFHLGVSVQGDVVVSIYHMRSTIGGRLQAKVLCVKPGFCVLDEISISVSCRSCSVSMIVLSRNVIANHVNMHFEAKHHPLNVSRKEAARICLIFLTC